MEDKKERVKICIIGDSGGKTSLIKEMIEAADAIMVEEDRPKDRPKMGVVDHCIEHENPIIEAIESDKKDRPKVIKMFDDMPNVFEIRAMFSNFENPCKCDDLKEERPRRRGQRRGRKFYNWD